MYTHQLIDKNAEFLGNLNLGSIYQILQYQIH